MHYFIDYDKKDKQLILRHHKKELLIIDDLLLKFRGTKVSLKCGKMHPEVMITKRDQVELPLRLRAASSQAVLKLADVSANLIMKEVDQCVMFSMENTMRESSFSADEAVVINISSIPGIKHSVFYHNRSCEFQNFDVEGLWWSQTAFVDDPSKDLNHDWGMLTFWQYHDGEVVGLMPFTNDKTIGRLQADRNGLKVISSDFRGIDCIDTYPLFLLCAGISVYSVRDQLFQTAEKLSSKMRLRTKKDHLKSTYDSLGWCSWNAYGNKVTEQNMYDTLAGFEQLKLPVKYIILDDGWLDVTINQEEKALQEGITNKKLQSLHADQKKFPSGLQTLIAKAKANGIEAFGVWHTLNGYWFGIAKESALYRENRELFYDVDGTDLALPEPGKGFFKRWHALLKSWGVDFIKVDNQCFARQYLPNRRSIPPYAAAIQEELQTSAKDVDFEIINCMATHAELIFNSQEPNMLRITNDFCPNDDYSSRLHLVNNFYNTFWLAKLFYPDFDMFQSSDKNAEAFGKMLSLSESPIYITDKTENIDQTLLKKMILPDGTIPRYDQPAEPLESCFFNNPYHDDQLLTVVAKKNIGDKTISTLAGFNTNEIGLSCGTQVPLHDLGIHDGKNFVYYENHETALVDNQGVLRMHLKSTQSILIHISPVINGFAPIGIIDYFAAPALIEQMNISDDSIEVKLKCAGLFVAYLESAPREVLSDGEKLKLESMDLVQLGGYHYKNGVLKIWAKHHHIIIKRS